MKENKKVKIILFVLLIIVLIVIATITYINVNKLKEENDNLKISINKYNTTNTLENEEVSNYVDIDTTNTSKNEEVSNSIDLDTTYSKKGIEFKYPSTFKQTDDTFEKSGFEAFEDNNKNRFQIQYIKNQNEIALKDIVEREKKLEMPNGDNYRTIVKKEEYITLPSGIKGYKFECTTIDNAQQIIFITKKDNIVYTFTFSIEDKLKYNDNIEISNKIFNSLKLDI